MELSSKVTAEFKNVPLIDYLATRFKYLSREEWLVRIADGRITHQNNPATPTTIVTQGDIVTYHAPDTSPPRRDYDVLYEDQWLLGVNKAPHLLVHASGPFIQENLIYQLRHWNDPPLPDAHLVNRLDRETSGVVLVAKNKAVLRQLSQQFAQTAVHKTYLALVHGRPSPSAGTIDASLIKLPKDEGPPRFAVSNEPAAKTAVTGYALIHPVGDDFSLIRLSPKTGRTHQLRVHLALLGHPIVGDKVYGQDSLADRHLLHCSSNRFIHPGTKNPLTIDAPLPADMRQFLDENGRDG